MKIDIGLSTSPNITLFLQAKPTLLLNERSLLKLFSSSIHAPSNRGHHLRFSVQNLLFSLGDQRALCDLSGQRLLRRSWAPELSGEQIKRSAFIMSSPFFVQPTSSKRVATFWNLLCFVSVSSGTTRAS